MTLEERIKEVENALTYEDREFKLDSQYLESALKIIDELYTQNQILNKKLSWRSDLLDKLMGNK